MMPCYVLALSRPSAASLRTARRTPGGSALPAAGKIRHALAEPPNGSLATAIPTTCSKPATADWRIPYSHFALRTSHFAPNPASRKTLALSRPGGHRGVPPPVPIPNTAVKRPSAYGTSSQDAGESVAARSAKRKSSNRLITHPQTNPIPRGGAAR